MNNNSKYKLKFVIFNSIIYAVILFAFYHINFIDFTVIRTLYMPILGLCIMAMLLDYILLGEVFLIASILDLTANYTVYVKQGLEPSAAGSYTNNTILILGLVVGFVIQMYVKSSKKNK